MRGDEERQRGVWLWFDWSILLVVAGLYCYWSWTPQLVGFGGDNASYALMAQAYSPYPHPLNLAAQYFTGRSQFPPLYPMLLALVDGGYQLRVGHLATTACLLLAGLVMRRWALRLGLPRGLQIVLILAFLCLPGTYRQTLSLHSENLYLLALLWFLSETSGRDAPAWDSFRVAVAATIPALVRSAGVALVVTYCLGLLWRRPARWGRALLEVLLPLVVWNLYTAMPGNHYANSLRLPTGAPLFDSLQVRAVTQLSALHEGWLQNMSDSGAMNVSADALGAVCLVGAAWRLWRGHADGLYVAAYLMLLVVWPFPAEATRFMFVLIPVLFVQGTWLVYHLGTQQKWTRYAGVAGMLVPLVAILIALPDLGLTLQRFRAPLPAALETFRRDPNFVAGAYPDALAYLQFSKALVESYSAIAAVVPKGECVWSIKPTLVGYYAGRRALAPPRAELGDEDFDIALRQGGCRYLLMLNVVSPTYGVPFYPLQRVKDRITIHWSSLRQADDQGPMLALIGELR